MAIQPIGQRLIHSLQSEPPDQTALVEIAQADPEAYRAFGITSETIEAAIAKRLQLLALIQPDLEQFCQQTLGWPSLPLETAWTLWLPLAQWICKRQIEQDSPLIQGILGGQGTGKTTLAIILSRILVQLGQRVCQLSIDDVYLTFAERQCLLTQAPELVWRGPPGTHDVALAKATLAQLAATGSAMLPRFDKSAWDGQGDRTTPEPVTDITVVLFEGWFVGMGPLPPERFESSQLPKLPWPIETSADLDFARRSNERLQAYLPLWDQLDQLIVLKPADYQLSQQWRRQAEQTMRAQGKPGMSDAQINDFVTYFWRSLHPELFLPPLTGHSDAPDRAAELVVDLDANHAPQRIYSPSH